MANEAATANAPATTSPTVALFQKAHAKMVTLQRVDEQLQSLLDQRDHLRLLVRARRIAGQIRVRLRRQSFERIEVLVLLVLLSQRGEQRRPGRTHLLTPKVIVNRVLQDALEQHRQFFGRLSSVLLGEFEHRILDDVERRILVADGEERLLERASFDLR